MNQERDLRKDPCHLFKMELRVPPGRRNSGPASDNGAGPVSGPHLEETAENHAC